MAKRVIWGAVAGGVAAVAVAGTVAFAVPAAAGGQAVAVGQAVSSTSAGADNTALCVRLKKADQKRQAVQTRLQGDVNTRGSIEWLKAKAAAATAAGDTTLAKLYTDKAALRAQVVDPLKGIDADLQAVIAAKCG